MTWDYRVLRHLSGGTECYKIHEVYYDDAGRPTACTEEEVSPSGESEEELRQDCAFFLRALELPVLEFSFFEPVSNGP